MLELEFCKCACGELSPSQRVMTEHHVARGTFTGVACAVGRSVMMPAVMIGKTLNVIDAAGYYQLGTVSSARAYESAADASQ